MSGDGGRGGGREDVGDEVGERRSGRGGRREREWRRRCEGFRCKRHQYTARKAVKILERSASCRDDRHGEMGGIERGMVISRRGAVASVFMNCCKRMPLMISSPNALRNTES